jgi:hypothetical protein
VALIDHDDHFKCKNIDTKHPVHGHITLRGLFFENLSPTAPAILLPKAA